MRLLLDCAGVLEIEMFDLVQIYNLLKLVLINWLLSHLNTLCLK